MIDDATIERVTEAVLGVLRARQAFIDENAAGWPSQVMGYAHIDMAKLALAEIVLTAFGYPDDPSIDDITAVWERREAERVRTCRMPPQWLRDRIFRRDGPVCPECGTTKDLSIDHIVPFSRGGETIESNLRVLCRPCNSMKGAKV